MFMRPSRVLWTLLTCSLAAEATKLTPPPEFDIPASSALDNVNLLIGNGGDTPNGSGGTIPSTAPPYGMTRWVAQTQVHYVSATPFNWTQDKVMGVVGTRQPAIWMGESGPISVIPGVTRGNLDIETDFHRRGLHIARDGRGDKQETISSGYYAVALEDGNGGTIQIEQTATSRVAHIRFTFNSDLPAYVLFEVTRPSVLTSTPSNVSFPSGSVVLTDTNEICGYSDERQDTIITPISIASSAKHFKGYFCARFDEPLPKDAFGVIKNQTHQYPVATGRRASGELLSAYIRFYSNPSETKTVVLRVGTSFISEEQARRNIDNEIPNVSAPAPSNTSSRHRILGTFENTAYRVRKSWADILDRIQVEPYAKGGEHSPSDDRVTVDLETFWTAVVHTLQFPSEQHEEGKYYSGYDNRVHDATGGQSYTGYSIWDTFRAAWAWQILLVPERIPGMVQSMLNDYKEGGWLPMWKNVVETSIMVGTHADSLIAEAVLKNVTGFDRELAWEAVWKDATVPPVKDWEVSYGDREENVDYEVRAGLSSVYNLPGKGWVADDVHSESASRTLDYAYDDYAAYVLARELEKPANITQFLLERALRTPFTLFNDATGFMEARNADGSWAGENNGWTEGDKWAYSFDVVHDIPTLIKRRGGKVKFVQSLEDHFNEGHNDHTNEPSHHIPYLYSLAGAAFKAQERIREIARDGYNNTPNGLSGNEDCGQMSAWYIFSAMGFYPVNPVSGEYVVGSPFFEYFSLDLQGGRKLAISAIGARTKPYVKSLTINGKKVDRPVIRHDQIAEGAEIVFEMSDTIEQWGNDDDILANFASVTMLGKAFQDQTADSLDGGHGMGKRGDEL